MKNNIEKYLRNYAEKGPWELTALSLENIENAVIIPALEEYPGILETLHSLAMNDPEELDRTLVVCVVNNRSFPHTTREAIANNLETLQVLDSLVRRRAIRKDKSEKNLQSKEILDSHIRLSYVNVSSPGFEMPVHGGVGLARKIGMDLSLALFQRQRKGRKLLLSLDADTLVQPNYLRVVKRHFDHKDELAAAVSFTHRKSDNRFIQKAIDFYESYLRYYVSGLKYARSPYAFHTVGSTIVSNAEGYAIVRGMPKRLAAEDFYFLNKISKISNVGFISDTMVFPSPRISDRTPFGTGNKMGQLIHEEESKALLYNPKVFIILKKWLQLIEDNLNCGEKTIQEKAAGINPKLPEYLKQIKFDGTWNKLRKNYPHRHNLLRQFHAWFDGLKTLKLIHYLSEEIYPKIPMQQAVVIMREIMDPHTVWNNVMGKAPSMEEILMWLQIMEREK